MELQYIKKIFDNESLYNKTKVNSGMFNDMFARVMFGEIGKAISQYNEFSPKYLTRLLNDTVQIDAFKKLSYPCELKEIQTILDYLLKYETDIRFETLENMIIDNFNRMKLSGISEKLAEDIASSNRTTKELLRKYSNEIDKLMYDEDELICSVSGNDFIKQELKALESGDKDVFYKTGFNWIDQDNGGVAKPSLICLAASKKAGKSMALYKFAVEQLKQGLNVLFCTIEIDEKQARRKLLSYYSKVPYKEIFNHNFTGENKTKYLKALHEFNELYGNRVFIYQNKTGVSTKEIEMYCNSLQKCGIVIDAIAIDYLGIMADIDRSSSLVERISKVVIELRIMKEKLGCIVMTAQQLHPSAEKKTIDKLDCDDVYYAKSIGMEFDVVGILAKDDSDQACIKVVAHRLGMSEDMFFLQDTNFNLCDIGEDVLFKF